MSCLYATIWASRIHTRSRNTIRPTCAGKTCTRTPCHRCWNSHAAAEDLARENGKRTVGLHVSGNNLPALRLYEDEGYEEISRQRSFLTGYFLNIRDWIYLQKGL